MKIQETSTQIHVDGSLPLDFGGESLRFLNISFNKFSGKIPLEFAKKIPMNSTIDISFNNFSGELPASSVFSNTDSNSLSGNPDLCGEDRKAGPRSATATVRGCTAQAQAKRHAASR